MVAVGLELGGGLTGRRLGCNHRHQDHRRVHHSHRLVFTLNFAAATATAMLKTTAIAVR